MKHSAGFEHIEHLLEMLLRNRMLPHSFHGCVVAGSCSVVFDLEALHELTCEGVSGILIKRRDLNWRARRYRDIEITPTPFRQKCVFSAHPCSRLGWVTQVDLVEH